MASRMPSMEQMVREGTRRYPQVKRQCEAQVVRWEWGTFVRHTHEPYYLERSGFSRGRLVKKPPRSPRGLCSHGFDSEGRLVVLREYTANLSAKHFNETFSLHGPGWIQEYHYDHDAEPRQKALINARLIRTADGRVERIERRWPGSPARATERYEYRDGLVKTVACRSTGNPPCVFEFAHDDLGRLTGVWVKRKTGRVQIFRKAPKGEGLAVLLPLIRPLYQAAARAAVKRLKVKEPIYALALVVDLENSMHLLPAPLAVAFVSERDRFLAEHRKRAGEWLWAPAEWKNAQWQRLTMTDKRLLSLCRKANYEICQKDRSKAARALCDEVAIGLQATDLGVPTTGDFVVFTLDVSSETGTTWIRKHAPAPLRKRLAAKGWL
jgi:hypothetical protein